jgi:hypothetical protein
MRLLQKMDETCLWSPKSFDDKGGFVMPLDTSPKPLAATFFVADHSNFDREDPTNAKSARFDRLVDALAPADPLELEITRRIVRSHIDLDEIGRSTAARLKNGEIVVDSKELASLVKLEAHLERMLAASLRDLRAIRTLRGRDARRSIGVENDERSGLDRSSPYGFEIDHSANEIEVGGEPVALAAPLESLAFATKDASSSTAEIETNRRSESSSESNRDNAFPAAENATLTITEPVATRAASVNQEIPIANESKNNNTIIKKSIGTTLERSERSDRSAAERSRSRASDKAFAPNRRESKRDRRAREASRSARKPSVLERFEASRIDPSGRRPTSFYTLDESVFANPFGVANDAFRGFIAVSAS